MGVVSRFVLLAMMLAGCNESGRPDGADLAAPDDGGGADAADGAVDLLPPPLHCSNGNTDGDETDLDCGGSCSPCLPGRSCLHAADCKTAQCLNNVCVDPPNIAPLPSFGPPAPYAAGTFPNRVALADFDGNGKLDVVAMNRDSMNASVLLGAGDGTLGAATNTALFSNVYGIGAADFNADTKADLVAVGNDNGGATTNWAAKVFIGNGNGTFQLPSSFVTCMTNGSGTCPSGLASDVMVTDVTGDQRADVLVVANGDGDNANRSMFTVLKGTSNGGFQVVGPTFASTNKPSGTPSFATADFDGDLKSDLVFLDIGGGLFRADVLLGNGDGSFGLPTVMGIGSGTGTVAVVAAGEFDSDGKQDLVSADVVLAMQPGKGDGTFKSAKTAAVGGNATSIAVADFNRDGKQDIVVTSYQGSIAVLVGRGDGTFTSMALLAGKSPTSVAVGDLNGDQKPDLVVADTTAVVVLLNTTP